MSTRRGVAAAAIAAVLVAGACTKAPLPTSDRVSPSPSAAPSLTPSAVTSSPGETIRPSPIALPDGLGEQAWVTARVRMGADDTRIATDVAIGLLGRPSTTVVAVPGEDGYVQVAPGGRHAVVFITLDTVTRVQGYRADDGQAFPGIDVDGRVNPASVVVDAEAGVVYAGFHVAGGVDIRRIGLDGSSSEQVIVLDSRFESDGMPTDHYGMTLATDGALVLFASADGETRLWRIMPGERAGAPISLAADAPELCAVVGATDRWLLAYDEDMCHVDGGEMPFPSRVVSLLDGSSRLLTDEPQVAFSRVLVIDGRPVGIADHRSQDWTTTSIERFDLESGVRTTVLDGVRNLDGVRREWLGVSAQVLPAPWVLIEPWGVGADEMALLAASVLNVVTGERIELPAGTAGWR